jgi:hypothetical protein
MGPRFGLDAVVRGEIPSLCRETNPGCPACSLVPILAELPRCTVLAVQSVPCRWIKPFSCYFHFEAAVEVLQILLWAVPPD